MQVERQTTGRSLGLEEALWLCRCLEDSVTITWVRYDMIWLSFDCNRTVLDSNMAMFFFADNFDNFMFQVFDTYGHPYDDKLSS